MLERFEGSVAALREIERQYAHLQVCHPLQSVTFLVMIAHEGGTENIAKCRSCCACLLINKMPGLGVQLACTAGLVKHPQLSFEQAPFQCMSHVAV